MVKKLLERFYERELRKQQQQQKQIELRMLNMLKTKGDKIYVKCKGKIICIIVGQTKKSQYFPKLLEHYSGTVKVELDPSNNAAKGDLN